MYIKAALHEIWNIFHLEVLRDKSMFHSYNKNIQEKYICFGLSQESYLCPQQQEGLSLKITK